MVVNISQNLVEALRKRAEAEGRDLGDVIEDAVREYLVSTSITDLSPEQIAETQMAMMPELDVPAYNGALEDGHETG